MKSYNLTYSQEALNQLPVDTINSAKSILIQLFTRISEHAEITKLLTVLESTFPCAVIIGTTTAGNIIADNITDNESVISITTFEETTLSLKHLKQGCGSNSFENGQTFAKELIQSDTKAMILFSGTHSANGQELLNGINAQKQKIIIAGGIAAPAANGKSLLISSHGISKDGIVAVTLHSKKLRIEHYYKSDWVPFGKKFMITHAEGNRVYTIDHMDAVDFFKHYLGEDVCENFQSAGLLFPLIKQEEHAIIPRTPIQSNEDGSVDFAAKIFTGEIYQFGFADLDLLLQNHNIPVENLQKQQSEAIFVYACVARRHIQYETAQKEIKPLTGITNVSGFFTYGEFYANNRENHLLNHTMTLLSLTERVPQENPLTQKRSQKQQHHFSTLTTLSHLIAVTNSELQEYNHYLEEKDTLLCQGPVINFKINLQKGVKCTYISQNVQRLLGYSTSEFISGKVPLRKIFDKETLRQLRHDLGTFSYNTHKTVYEKEIKAYSKSGKEKYLHFVLAIQRNHPHLQHTYIGYFIDITAQAENRNRIQKLAYYDHITGLPNRELLKRTLQQKIDEASTNDKFCAVSFFDLDKFKDVNDTYGHTAGDKLLQLIANRIKTILKKDDFLARIGGDEFILIHSNLNRQTLQNSILATVNRILTLIHEPFSIDGKIAHISTSIGTAVYGIDGESVEDLIKHADMAMYEAKNDPHVHFKFYSHTMRVLREEELFLKHALKQAVRNKEFHLLYQPQVDINSGRIIGAEALMRWEHPIKGVISPVKFIPLAEEMNLIVELGEWLLEEVCHKIKILQNDHFLPETFKTISINISPVQFNDPYFITKVKRIIDLLQIDTSYLEFELTEGIFVENMDHMVEKMHQLKEMGITISLDDFGTGYSSLQYLKKLPIDTIKIDRAFITNLQNNKHDQILTSTIIQLSQNMQCKIVAEGVENLEQLKFLEENKCETYQGFYFSKPIPFKALEILLHEEIMEIAEG